MYNLIIYIHWEEVNMHFFWNFGHVRFSGYIGDNKMIGCSS